MKASHILAFVGGTVAGIVVGMLLAPDSGKNIRQKIANELREKGITLDAEHFKNLVDKVITKLHDNFTDDELSNTINDVMNE